MTGPPAAQTTGRRASFNSSGSFSVEPGIVEQCITVGVPKEAKAEEYRVGLTPQSASVYIQNGHKVIVQAHAGDGSGFPDEMYRAVGCEIKQSMKEVYDEANMIVKVKEPMVQEYQMIRPGQVVYAYFHFASSRKLTEAMVASGAICVAYETVETDKKTLPLLTPMSEIGGRMSIQQAMKYLEKPLGGSGVLLSGSPGVRPGHVTVLGGGVVGVNAAKIACGIGATVTVLDINVERLRELEDMLPKNCRTLFSNEQNIRDELKLADVVVGAVNIPGEHAPCLVKKEYLKTMKPGSIIVDVSVDQGGCIETCKPTTHQQPTYVVDGIIHYCVANIPGAVPYTATLALSNVTLAYGLQLASRGWVNACACNHELRKGMNVVHGKVTNPGVAKAHGYQYTHPETVLTERGATAIKNPQQMTTKHGAQQIQQGMAGLTVSS